MKQRKIIAALAAFITASFLQGDPAFAGKENDTLNIGLRLDHNSLGAFDSAKRENVIISRVIWDGLMYRNPQTGEYLPNLALAYRWENETSLVFDLREGVQYHNGEVFDADDVVFTLNWLADEKNKAVPQRNFNWLQSAEKRGPYSVKVNLKSAFPAALEYLSGPISILPNETFQKVGRESFGQNPIGTGPYKVTRFKAGDSITFVKNEAYHKDSPKGQPSIQNMTIKIIQDKKRQFAELFSGKLDWIWQVPADSAKQLEAVKKFTVVPETTMRIGYLAFDASGATGETPMADVRVRKAIAHAVNREALVKSLVKGGAKVVHSACFPSQFGCSQDVMKYAYDLKKAKALLAEAGYPNGFKITLDAYRDKPYADAIIKNLAGIGVMADLSMHKYAELTKKIGENTIPFRFMTWGSYSINDVSAITSRFFKHGPEDYARDEEVKQWLDIADSATDPKTREENYAKALAKIASEAYWLPLWSYSTNYVFSSSLNFTPTSDEIPRFFQASWK